VTGTGQWARLNSCSPGWLGWDQKGFAVPLEVGHGIKVARVDDPFGYSIGLIFNPGFKPKEVS
jgi:hypothetical protein